MCVCDSPAGSVGSSFVGPISEWDVVVSQTRWLVSRLSSTAGTALFIFVYSGAICPAVVLIRSWCVTPQEGCTATRHVGALP